MKKFSSIFVKVILGIGILTLFVVISRHTSSQDIRSEGEKELKVQQQERAEMGEMDVVPLKKLPRGVNIRKLDSNTPSRPAAGTDQGDESEPNSTCGTADALTGTEGKIRGHTFPTATDVDWYSFTAPAGSKVYATVQTSFSAQGADAVLEVIAPNPDCSTITVLELDDEDGTFGGSSPSIAGTSLTAGGTYYFRVTNFSTTSFIAPYNLYYAIRSTAPTAETEPNNNGTPQVIPASEYVSGTIGVAGDTDTFTFTAAAGETVFVSLDLDPERDNVAQYNGRVGLGLFGTPTLFLVTGDAGTFDTIDSEAMLMTIRTAGSYQIYTDAQVAGNEGATATYNFNLMRLPATAGTCTTYTNAVATPIADLALTTSTISVPTTNPISKVTVDLNLTHTSMPDLDVHLRSPANNDNGIFTDIGAASQVGMNETFADNGAIPPLFAAQQGIIYSPELSYRLDWFRGENPNGTWSLDIRDDLTANSGTLTSWSLNVCDEPAPTGTLIYNQDFEASDGGYTHSGTADEWERGTPATAAQTVTSPFIAAFTNCASGTNCWKTDLDNTYDISSSQNLVSPTLNLTQYAGTIKLYWQQRYQMENVGFDRIWVAVTEVGNPTNTRIVWHANNATMGETNGSGASVANLPESAGWGRYNADISDFAGKRITVTFHLESDSSINYGGWAVDDVQLRHVGVVAASVPVGGRVMNSGGYGISRATVTLTPTGGGETRTALTNSFGYYSFDDVQVGQNYILQVNTKRYSFDPQAVFVTEETVVNFTANP